MPTKKSSASTLPSLLITREIPQVGLELLKPHFNIQMVEKGRPLTPVELKQLVKGKDAIISMLTDNIDEKFLKSNSQLKIISNFAVGYNNIDLAAASKLGIPVTNTPGKLTDAVSEFTVGLMLAAARRITEGDRYLRAGKFKGWAPNMLIGQTLLGGKTVGIIGLGRIGLTVAKILRLGFGMTVIYSDVKQATAEIEKEYGLRFTTQDNLLSLADFVSLNVPLLPSTKHLINAKTLKLMKSNAILINTSRGPVVEEKALAEALKKKQIAGAALDVFEFEPKVVSSLKTLDNVVLTPHLASAVQSARDEMAVMAADSVLAVFAGRKLDRLVNADYIPR